MVSVTETLLSPRRTRDRIMGVVIHSVMAILIRDRFLPVLLGFLRPFLPNTPLPPCLPLPYHYLGCCSHRRGAVCYHILLAPFSRLGSFVLYWIVSSDSQSFYSGRDTLLYSSVGDFWVVHSARSRCLFTAGLLGSIHRGRSHSSSEFLLGCLFSFIFAGQRSFQPRVQSAKWADSARAPSQVNGRSSPHYDISSLSQSLRMFIPRRLLSGSNFIVFTIIKI